VAVDAQHLLRGFEALVDIGVMADLDAAPAVQGERQRILADHSHRRELHLQAAGSVVAVGSSRYLSVMLSPTTRMLPYDIRIDSGSLLLSR
jgi:hypothetical protein